MKSSFSACDWFHIDFRCIFIKWPDIDFRRGIFIPCSDSPYVQIMFWHSHLARVVQHVANNSCFTSIVKLRRAHELCLFSSKKEKKKKKRTGTPKNRFLFHSIPLKGGYV